MALDTRRGPTLLAGWSASYVQNFRVSLLPSPKGVFYFYFHFFISLSNTIWRCAF
ncbi:hypothetical protein BDQ94DRAFT_142199 [Aspergillus welwitschiae]|uniref:Uncharacterized protein n=1 Tax=Aspergillus welwitschiae TaxID=1341132 RepID=A0A3F3Q4Z8_9EURO|nr:hypothetical protein BDQ94DRAFT_142199 [Aspergillus welwitschiae]RDH34165.1 hypothetical protein BDQ94DRAFT_142199 [Aspergillus welwitschiae]